MNVIFAGNNERSIKCLNFLSKKKIKISLVICHKKINKNGYFKNLKFLAKQLRYDYITPKNINSLSVKKKIKSFKPDLMILCGYSQNILKSDIFNIPKHGTWNMHASDLPKYRGASPLNWAIINNEKKIGISIIQVDKSLDGGDIIGKIFLKLKKNENIKTLTNKVNILYPKILYKKISELKKGSLKKKKQNPNRATFFTRRLPADSFLKFGLSSAEKIQKIINASVYPYPEAYFYFKKQKISVGSDTKILNNNYGIPGRIIKRDKKSITVICKNNSIKLNQLYKKGKVINPTKIKLRPGFDLT